MEPQESGAEVVTQGFLGNRFAVLVAALVGLAVIGLCVLGLFVAGILPPGTHTAATARQATATRITIVIATATSAPPQAAGGTAEALPTATETPVSLPTYSGAPIPTVTPLLASTPTAPPAGAPPVPVKAAAGIYVTNMRVDPPHPVKNSLINFYVTFVNPTGASESHRLCVETYRPGDTRSFGITSCPSQSIPPGTHVIKIGTWNVTGVHQCIPVLARPISRDGDNRSPYHQANGSDLWLEFSVCP